MFAQIARTAAALACTLVLSATCIVAAVGPAATHGPAVASAARMMA